MKNLFIGLSFLLLSCNTTPKVNYKYTNELKSFTVSAEIPINTKNVIMVLQNEDCICTEENMAFTMRLFESTKYKNYKKTLIVKTDKHKILTQVKNIEQLQVIIDHDGQLGKSGLILTTDKMFIFDSSELVGYADLKTSPTDELVSTYL